MTGPEGDTDPGVELADWVRDVAGARRVTLERRSGGGSRAGYAVLAEMPDGSDRELWLRCDTGAGPQSDGAYTVRREASVYRQVRARGIRVAEVLEVHPTVDAFLMTRLHGRNWFSELTDPDARWSIATEFVEELAALHRIDPDDLDLPELGPLRPVRDLVVDELDIWEAQFRAHPEPEPTIELALSWLRRHLPEPGRERRPVLVHGDTGTGNFMYEDGHLVAVTDWELAHWGDPHDDLGWLYVHDLQDPVPDLPAHLRDYERAVGSPIDPERLRYHLVMAQARCAIGTRGGLLARDSRGEIGSHLLFTTLHTRALADALAVAMGVVATPPSPVLADPGPSDLSWIYDVVLDDLRRRVVPAIDDGFAARRGKGAARLVKYLREEDRLGSVVARAERDDLLELLGGEVREVGAAQLLLCERIRSGSVADDDVVRYCVRSWARRTEVLRPAMGSLADRRHAPLP